MKRDPAVRQKAVSGLTTDGPNDTPHLSDVHEARFPDFIAAETPRTALANSELRSGAPVPSFLMLPK